MNKVPAAAELQNPAISVTDVLGMAALSVVLLLYSYLRGRHKMFWSDEIMGVLVLKQPTFAAAQHAWRDGIDSSGIWFEVLARPWTGAFGFSEFSLRFFSALGVCASTCFLWITARRFYSPLVVGASISVAYATSLAMIWQLANGRTYGLFLTAAAMVLWLLFRGEDEDARKPSMRFLLLTAFSYCFLVGSHILGPLYAGGFLGMQVLLDLKARRFRPLFYVAAALSGAVLWYSRANLRATMALGKPSFWTVRPQLKELVTLDHRLCGVIFVALLLVGFSLHVSRRRMTVYLVLIGFAGLDLLIWAYSRVGTSIYVNRYLLPFCFAAALILCELLTQLREANLPHHFLRKWFPIVLVAIAFMSLFVPRLDRPWLPTPNYTQAVLQSLPVDLPLISPDPGVFAELEYYHHPGQTRVLFPVDWPIVLDRTNVGGVSGMHEMDNFKAEGLYANDIQPGGTLLNTMRDFAVIAKKSSPWLRRRILDDPRFVTTALMDEDAGTVAGLPGSVWRVHTR